MTCVVCGKRLREEDQTCPRCGFPKVYFPGDYKEGLRAIQPQIAAHRDDFLKTVRVGLVIYRWKAGTERVEMDRQEVLPLGACADFGPAPVWLEQRFARVPGETEITVQLQIEHGQACRSAEMTLPNLPAAELQQVGVSLDERLQLALHLKNAAGEQAQSQRVPLFL